MIKKEKSNILSIHFVKMYSYNALYIPIVNTVFTSYLNKMHVAWNIYEKYLKGIVHVIEYTVDNKTLMMSCNGMR
jgi:hypothetical protein